MSLVPPGAVCPTDDDAVAELASRSEAFIATFSRPPTQADIAADADWKLLYDSKRAAERAAAGSPLPGGCSVFVVRRRRFCSHAAADGARVCSVHAAAAAAAGVTLPALRLDVPVEAEPLKPAWTLKRNLKRRMKTCSNPLALQHLAPPTLPDWRDIFAQPSLPILLDIGCAKGRWLGGLATSAEFASRFGRHNFVGLELFAPLVTAANAWRDAAKLSNLHYVAGAASASLGARSQTLLSSPIRVSLQRIFAGPVLDSLAASGCGPVARVCIQFPDPWGEADNAAKRLVTPAFAALLATLLPPGCELFLVSDVMSLAAQMRERCLATPAFALHPLHSPPRASRAGLDESSDDHGAVEWLPVRPYGSPTERDLVCEQKWRPVHRALLVRTHETAESRAAAVIAA